MPVKWNVLALLSFIFLISSLSLAAQDEFVRREHVERGNGFFAFQVGIPSVEMRKAIKNNMGNLGFGAGFAGMTNPFSWGSNKRNSPLRIGGELGYTYYGRFLSKVNINGYQGDYKTSYGILQLNGILQLRPRQTEKITPFFELLAGGDFYLSTIKENLDVIESSLGIQSFELDGYSSASFNKGLAVGCYIGNPKDRDEVRLLLRLSYNRGNAIKYVVRNSLTYNPGNNRLEYYVDRAPVNYFNVQIGIGR
jgi:hypothetical protein